MAGKVIGWVAGIAAVAVAGTLWAAWNHGKDLAERDEVIKQACWPAAATPDERAYCIARMEESYRGPMTQDRAANAAAQHVEDHRIGAR